MSEHTESATATGDASKSEHGHDHKEELGFYFKIFYALMGLTALTVVAGLLPDWGVPVPEAVTLIVAMVIASIKGSLVVLFFMHLKMEKKNIYIIAGVPLVLAIILLFALGPDIAGWAGT